MALDEENKRKLSELRKIERQAKQLIYKMRRLEDEWKRLRGSLNESGENIPQALGDVLANWNRLV